MNTESATKNSAFNPSSLEEASCPTQVEGVLMTDCL